MEYKVIHSYSVSRSTELSIETGEIIRVIIFEHLKILKEILKIFYT